MMKLQFFVFFLVTFIPTGIQSQFLDDYGNCTVVYPDGRTGIRQPCEINPEQVENIPRHFTRRHEKTIQKHENEMNILMNQMNELKQQFEEFKNYTDEKLIQMTNQVSAQSLKRDKRRISDGRSHIQSSEKVDSTNFIKVVPLNEVIDLINDSIDECRSNMTKLTDKMNEVVRVLKRDRARHHICTDWERYFTHCPLDNL